MKFRRSENPTAEMPFLEHLEELRWRLLWSLLALTVATVASFIVVTQFNVIGILKRPAEPYLTATGGELVNLTVVGPFFITLKVAVSMGLVLASPIIFYQVWSFLSPALMPKEKRAIIPALYLGLILFAAGAALAYFVALPFTMRFMTNFQADSLVQYITADDYFGFVVKLLLGFGAMFEMPVIIMVLTAIGLANSKFLASKRRYAVAIMAIASALLTPGDVIVPTLVLMGPLLLLYEFSIVLAKLVEKKTRAKETPADNEILPEATA